MVGFVGRFRKPKAPIVLGSPQKDGVEHQQTAPIYQNITPPILRNFSYPTSITNSYRPPSISAAQIEPPSTWDQLGEICNFSPDTASRTGRARTAGLEDPFFYTTDRTPRKQSVDQDEIPNQFEAKQSTDSVPPSQQTAKNVEKGGSKDKVTKPPRGHSIGDHTLPPKPLFTARLKRNSLGRHKTSSSFDAARFLILRPNSFERPMSSSGVPLIDTRLKHSTSSLPKVGVSPLSFPGDTIEDFSTGPEKELITLHTTSALGDFQMDVTSSRSGSQELRNIAPGSNDVIGDQRCTGQAPGSVKYKTKEGKIRWFSQLKDWVSVSEPSTQALKDYKKETYKKAGIALDDPRANAKLHLPVGTLPPGAIKPGGRGLDPEEIVLQRAAQQKKTRQTLSTVTGTSQGSRSSASHCSSSSSVAISALKDKA
ncbi:hypothetical protein F5Y19DRAFT_472977 [Xylariaceae sp. FL1651]|nr:hypothetical protein F5Y19DRAFT_472977 [Xylariaceae sp. FL1651]